MPSLNHINSSVPKELAGNVPAGASRPVLMPVLEACRVYGGTRTWFYLQAGLGNIIFRKMGRRTLVDVASLENYIATLPVAAIKPPYAVRKAAAEQAAA